MTLLASSKPLTTNGQTTLLSSCSNYEVRPYSILSYFFSFFDSKFIVGIFYVYLIYRKDVQRDSWFDCQSIHVIVRGFSMQHVESDARRHSRAVQQFRMGNSRRRLSAFDCTTPSARSQSQHRIIRKSVGQIDGFRVIFGELTLCDRFKCNLH